MSPHKRRGLLGLALAGTVAAVVFAPEPTTDSIVLSVRQPEKGERPGAGQTAAEGGRSSSSRSAPSVERAVLAIRPRVQPDELESIFVVPARVTPPGPPSMPVAQDIPPPPPQAPPLPFRYLGRYVDNGSEKYFLQYNDESIVAGAGDLIAGAYRLEGFREGGLIFVFLPLQQTQTLPIGAAN